VTYRPTFIERAFTLAASGRISRTSDIRAALKAEGYSDEGQLYGRTIQQQLQKLMAKAKAERPDF
jgi:hypothetical protein